MEARHCLAGVLLVSAGCVEGAHSHYYPESPGPTISGRIENPHGLEPEDGVLTVGTWTANSGSSEFVRVNSDGTFKTHGLDPGLYSLVFVRTHSSPVAHATPVSDIRFVRIGREDVTDVALTLRQDMELTGRYRVEGDLPNPPWPRSIHISAERRYQGERWGAVEQVAHALEDGRFVLRNAYGPYLLDVSYERGPGSPWGNPTILLDGRDITDVPTDFSAHTGSTLEVVIPYTGPRDR